LRGAVGGAGVWVGAGYGGALAAGWAGRAVVDLAYRPDDDAAAAGDRWIGRVRRIDRRGGAAFIDLGAAPDAYAKAAAAHEGALVAVTIAQPARPDDDKGARAVDLEPAPAGARIGRLRRASAAARAQALWSDAPVRVDGPTDAKGWTARRALFDHPAVDAAFEIAAAPTLALPGGGRLTLHPTPALLVADVDAGGGARVVANGAAIDALMRALRLRGEGGLTILDLIDPPRRGRPKTGDEAAALCDQAAAAAALDPARPRIGRVSPHWTLDLSRPRRAAPLSDWFAEDAAIARGVRAALRRVRAAADAAPGRVIALRCVEDVAGALAGPAAADLDYAAAQAGAAIEVAADAAATSPTAQPR